MKTFSSIKQLSKNQQNLVSAALIVLKNAHCPYSNFLVGAAIETNDGKIFVGTNVETATFSPNIHAEQAAIASAVAKGHRGFLGIAVIGKHRISKKTQKSSEGKDVIPVCGDCRQLIAKFANLSGINTEIIMASSDLKNVIVAKVSELLPLPFGPEIIK